ncbi:stage III sporulation protein AG [Herbivorax sp. ANBcel31]|uniref:stage III sporulation protein AG n=1 Tax=Herbivorax sp. ANBcel31 TaxID=3069754 RepID=UPI0027B231B0|nr:stage III sporulation protein AG [Herbivorax sp. ANBcel31]MDQ2085305.1 stage III sporulation protein AG [Herbivorax sp. ANBcel31]
MEKIKKFIKKLKNMFDKDNKKLGENLVILIIIGVIIIIAGGSFFGGDKKENTKIEKVELEEVETSGIVESSDEKEELELKMEEILSQIEGAGKVRVLITYESGKELVPFTDIKKNDDNVDEVDSAGGTRTSEQSSFESSVVYEEEGGGVKNPFIVKEVYPVVKGVVVVADGGADLTVRESLLKAVQVLLDVPVHRIQVYERKK